VRRWLRPFSAVYSAGLLGFSAFAPVQGAAAESAPTSTAAAGGSNIAPAEARQRLAELRAQIALADVQYHRDAMPEISDFEYDQLKQRAAALERAFPEIARSVPAVPEIGDDRTGLFQTARHRERMLSLDKTYAEADVRAFHTRVAKQLGREDLAYVVEPKFDGFAVSVTYERGRLVRAVTRGNGTEGDDITANALRIQNLPRGLPAGGEDDPAVSVPDLVEVRGEIFVPFAEFARVNAEREAAGEPPFANPRNLAAGTIRQFEPAEVARRGLRVVFYAVGACEPQSALPATQHELPDRFRAWGLPGIAPEQVWRASGGGELWPAIEALRRARPGFEFPTDGAVVKLDSLAGQRELGAGESAPHWAIAYKFAPDRVETKVRAITIQVGRTGVLTPVAELAPVSLAGSTVARATLHNRADLTRKDIRVGDTVYVEKAGEIIPAIVGVNLDRRPAIAAPFVFPEKCPACGAAVVKRPGEVAVRCANAGCPAQLRRRIEHFASPDALGIEGLGPVAIDALVESGRMKTLPDLYRLDHASLSSGTKLGEKAAGQILASITRSKHAELWRFIYGLGIPQVGVVASHEIANRAGSLEALLALPVDSSASGAAGSARREDPAWRATLAFLADPANRALLAEMRAAGVQPVAPGRPVDVRATVAGKVFVLTGTLPTLTRAQATAQIQSAGGKVTTTVSRTTTYVVAGAEPGAKLEQARALGVPVIDEAGLRKMLSAVDGREAGPDDAR
jgi:DNA ligase (NAD+)